jgi:hypothetical protein
MADNTTPQALHRSAVGAALILWVCEAMGLFLRKKH